MVSTEALEFNSAVQLGKAILAGNISACELIARYRARINKYNKMLNAVCWTDWDEANTEAQRRDREIRRGHILGPLHGLPITVKEAIAARSTPTTWGVSKFKDCVSADDAVCVDRLRRAGAIIIGKTNIAEYLADHRTVNPVYGRTNNPWDLSRTSGGSSGGAAAALAAGLTGLDVGTDIAGSVRNPAHYCGIYAHKPTFGLCSTEGYGLPGTWAPLDMNTIGPMARSADDLAIELDVLAGIPGAGSRSSSDAIRLERVPKNWRIGVTYNDNTAPVSKVIRDAIHRVAEFAAMRGAKIEEVETPLDSSASAFTLFVQLLRSATVHYKSAEEYRAAAAAASTMSLAGSESKMTYSQAMLKGQNLTHRDWLLLNEKRHLVMKQWHHFFMDYDLWLCPAACTVAPAHDDTINREDRKIRVDGVDMPCTNDLFWPGLGSMAYLPCTVAPIGSDPNELPIGIQIVGGWGKDHVSIKFAQFLEREYYSFKAPPLYAL